MVNKLKPENENTTIAISKVIKAKLRFYAQPTKVTKMGQCYESDDKVLARILKEYMETHKLENPVPHSTYPQQAEKVKDKVEKTINPPSTVPVVEIDVNDIMSAHTF